MLASEFGDDYDAIPAYEQIYALAGPTQTYRITGDPRILDDIEMTVRLFDQLLPRPRARAATSPTSTRSRSTRVHESLGHNRARKNWNSVGDHAPAYLINLWLATGEHRYADFLEYTFDTIVEHFPDYEQQPVRPREVPRGLEPRPRTGAGSRTGRSSATTSRSPGT